MKKILLAVLVGVLMSGCASYMAVKDHNTQLDQKALMLRINAANDGSPSLDVGIDLMNAKGYLGAWKADKGKMVKATIIDAILAYGAYEGYQQISDSHNQTYNDSDVSSEGGVQIEVSGTVNAPTTINIVNGDSNQSNNDEAVTGTSNRDMYQPL